MSELFQNIVLRTAHEDSLNPSPVLPEQLVTTSTMLRYYLTFNSRYRLVICTKCSIGVPLNHLHAHLSASSQRRLDTLPALGSTKSKDRIVLEPHGLRPPKDLNDIIVQELREMLGNPSFSADDFCSTDIKKPYPHQVGPVLGLQILEQCYGCKRCNYVCPALSTMRSHRTTHTTKGSEDSYKRDQERIGVMVQTFFSGNNRHFFEITPTRELQDSTNPTASTADVKLGQELSGVEDPATLLRLRKATILGEGEEIDQTSLDRRQIHPIYFDLNIYNFLKCVDRTQALVSLDITRKGKRAPRSLTRLRDLVGRTFYADCNELTKIHDGLGRLLMNSSP